MAAAQPLREQHKQYTRELILRTFARMLVERGGLADISIQQVADRAGVTHRTVYRHFASRQELVDELADWLDQRLVERGGVQVPANPDELPAALEHNYRLFDDDAEILTALTLATWGARRPARAQQERTRAFAQALAPLTRGLAPAEARAFVALVRYLASSRAWLAFREEFGLQGREVGPVLAWALHTLIEALPRRTATARRRYKKKEVDHG